MKSLLSVSVRQEVNSRLENLLQDSIPRWGRMSPIQMLAHLSLQMECAINIRKTERMPASWLFRLFRKLIIFGGIPWWPHGLPTAPSWKNPETKGWEYEIQRFKKLLERFSEAEAPENWGAHPLFGQLNRKEWGRLGYLHIEHHFRQFGI